MLYRVYVVYATGKAQAWYFETRPGAQRRFDSLKYGKLTGAITRLVVEAL